MNNYPIDFKAIQDTLKELKQISNLSNLLKNKQDRQLLRAYIQEDQGLLETMKNRQKIDEELYYHLETFRHQIFTYLNQAADVQAEKQKCFQLINQLFFDDGTNKKEQLDYFQEKDLIQNQTSVSHPPTSTNSKLKVFLFIVSGLQFKSVKVKKNRTAQHSNLEEVQVNILPVLMFNNHYITYLQFQTFTEARTKYYVHFKEAWSLTSKWEAKVEELKYVKDVAISFLFTKTTIGIDNKIINFTLLSSIKYFIAINATKCSQSQFLKLQQEEIFPFLYLLKRQFKLDLSQAQEQALYKQLKISQSTQPQVGLDSKYFMCFFKAVYQNYAQEKFYKFKIYNSVKFNQPFVRHRIGEYQKNKIKKLQQFYFKIGYQCLKYVKNTGKNRNQLLSNFLKGNIYRQKQEQVLNNLKVASQSLQQSQHLWLIDEDISKYLKKSPKVSAFDYYNIRGGYLKLNLKSLKTSSPAKYQNYIDQKRKIQLIIQSFLEDLIHKFKSVQSYQPVTLNEAEVLDIFLSLDQCNLKQLLLKPQKYLSIVKKIKQLVRVSKNTMNFKVFLENYIKITEQYLERYCIPEVIEGLLLQPCTQFDKQQLIELLKFAAACKLPFKKIFEKILENVQAINIQNVLQCFIGFFSNASNSKIIWQQNLLAYLAYLRQLEGNANKSELLAKMFNTILQTVKFSDQTYQDSIQTYIQALHNIQVNEFKRKILSHLFKEIQRVKKQKVYDIFETLYQLSSPLACRFQHKTILQQYIEMKGLNDKQLQEIIWYSLQKKLQPFQRIFLQKNYQAIQQKIIQKLSSDDCYHSQVVRMVQMMKKMNQSTPLIKQILVHLGKAIFQSIDKFERFMRKAGQTLMILNSYKNALKTQKQYLEWHLRGLENSKLANFYKLNSDIIKIYEQSQTINPILRYKFWRNKKVTDLSSFYNQYLYVSNLVKKQLKKLSERELSFIEFEHFFSESSFQHLLVYFCSSEEQKKMLKQYKVKCKLQFLQKLSLSSSQIVSINEEVNSELAGLLKKLNSLLEKIKYYDSQLNIYQVLECVRAIQLYKESSAGQQKHSLDTTKARQATIPAISALYSENVAQL